MRTFLEVAATGSFQLASERLHVTQSTVSTRIKVLERRLDGVLFLRRRAGAELTAAGRHFHRYALTAVRAWEQARHDIALPAELSAVVGLGIQPALWDRIGYPWIERLQARAPDLAVRTAVDYSESLTRFLCDGFLDVAVLYVPQQRPNLVVERLLEEDLVMVSGDPDRAVGDAWVEDYVFVDWGDDFRRQHSLAFPGALTPRLQLDHTSMALEFVRARGACGYLLESTVRPYLERGELHRVKQAPVFHQQAYVAYPEEPLDGRRLQLALESLRDLVGPMQGPDQPVPPNQSTSGTGDVATAMSSR